MRVGALGLGWSVLTLSAACGAPVAAPTTRVPRQIQCGERVCLHTCCPHEIGGPACLDAEGKPETPEAFPPEIRSRDDWTGCTPSTNGQSVQLACDGPEDCGSGRVCCYQDPTMSARGGGAYCSESCTGSVPLAMLPLPDDPETPLLIVCHVTEECTRGGLCKKGPWGLRTCQK